MVGKLTSHIGRQVTNLKTFCIGNSLGAHLCGFAGKEYKLTGIIGMDAAAPIFKTNSGKNRLDKGDAKAVHVFHSNTMYEGIKRPIGDVDFYINGGRRQGWRCGHELPGFLIQVTSCSHHFASKVFLYATAIQENYPNNICATNIFCPIQNVNEVVYGHFEPWPKERSSLRKSTKVCCMIDTVFLNYSSANLLTILQSFRSLNLCYFFRYNVQKYFSMEQFAFLSTK